MSEIAVPAAAHSSSSVGTDTPQHAALLVIASPLAPESATEVNLPLFREGTLTLRTYAQEPVITTQARVREEIVVRKNAGERVEIITETARRTTVDIEPFAPSRSS